MKDYSEYLPYLLILVPICFMVGGIYLAMNGIHGWGWLIVGAIGSSNISIKSSGSKKKKKK